MPAKDHIAWSAYDSEKFSQEGNDCRIFDVGFRNVKSYLKTKCTWNWHDIQSTENENEDAEEKDYAEHTHKDRALIDFLYMPKNLRFDPFILEVLFVDSHVFDDFATRAA